MKYQYYTMIGLIFDLAGAFLVAVEAIKIENLRSLRDRFLKTMHNYTLSPRIVFVDKNGQSAIVDPKEERPAESFPGVFMALHYIAGFLVLFLANILLDGWIVTTYQNAVCWILGVSWCFFPAVLLSLPLIAFGVFWGLGEVVHVSLTGTLICAMKAVDFIVAKTPSGTVGILGFILLAVGFTLQFLGTYLSIE